MRHPHQRKNQVGGDGMRPLVEGIRLSTDRLAGTIRPVGARVFNVDATNVIRGH